MPNNDEKRLQELMEMMKKDPQNQTRRPSSRMPENSPLYEKVVPTLLVFMAVVTVVMILFAIGILTGLISF